MACAFHSLTGAPAGYRVTGFRHTRGPRWGLPPVSIEQEGTAVTFRRPAWGGASRSRRFGPFGTLGSTARLVSVDGKTFRQRRCRARQHRPTCRMAWGNHSRARRSAIRFHNPAAGTHATGPIPLSGIRAYSNHPHVVKHGDERTQPRAGLRVHHLANLGGLVALAGLDRAPDFYLGANQRRPRAQSRRGTTRVASVGRGSRSKSGRPVSARGSRGAAELIRSPQQWAGQEIITLSAHAPKFSATHRQLARLAHGIGMRHHGFFGQKKSISSFVREDRRPLIPWWAVALHEYE